MAKVGQAPAVQQACANDKGGDFLARACTGYPHSTAGFEVCADLLKTECSGLNHTGDRCYDCAFGADVQSQLLLHNCSMKYVQDTW
jgi:hypothetical protein